MEIKGKKILAEGDSWLSMPRTNIFWGKPANIVACLRGHGLRIKNISSCGDELAGIYAGKMEFRDYIQDYDLCLMSAGGNDIAGKWDFHRLVFDSKKQDWYSCIDHKRLADKMLFIKLCAQEIAEIADAARKPIIMHKYDIPYPREVGASFFGGLLNIEPRGWLGQYMPPHLGPKEQRNIIRYMLKLFATTLKECETEYFRVCDTQGTLTHISQWRDEMHPTPAGMELIACKILDFIKAM